jgi:hypothetical protein
MPRKPSSLRRCLAVLGTAFLAVAWTIGITIPASAWAKGSLDIVSVTDIESGLPWPVQDRPFKVTVRVLDGYGKPTTVKYPTKIVLEEVSGPGVLGGTTTAVIPANGSGTTISGATYSEVANGVVLRVRAISGVHLGSDQVTVEVALTATGRDAAPGKPLTLEDRDCAAPTKEVPNCGELLLPNGARGHVTLSVGSCEGLAPCMTEGSVEALVVTAIANLKDSHGKPLYSRTSPATVVLECDKALCREIANGVPKIPVRYTLNNTGPLTEKADPCPKKGIIGANQEACVDYVQSRRHHGDLYLYFLFVKDVRITI